VRSTPDVPATPHLGPLSVRDTVDTAVALDKGVGGKLSMIRQVCRQIFGVPDYERYLAHAARRHPGSPILSRRAFCAQAIERKYGKSGPRCC
jgi:uncharacterized short protein YbdD (DUF466 family)